MPDSQLGFRRHVVDSEARPNDELPTREGDARSKRPQPGRSSQRGPPESALLPELGVELGAQEVLPMPWSNVNGRQLPAVSTGALCDGAGADGVRARQSDMELRSVQLGELEAWAAPCVGPRSPTEGGRPWHDTRSVHWGARQGPHAAQPKLGCSLAFRWGWRFAGLQPGTATPPGLASGPPANGLRPGPGAL
eukprot:12316360-Alexandrium_andersonii.AAC.1